MEVVLFHRHGRKVKSPYVKPLKELTAIISPAEMLADAKRKDLLEKITEYSSLELTRFESLCLPLIQNLINHCQRLPETANSYYALPGGLVDHALNRTEAALNLFRHYIINDDGQELTEEQKLWIYALFSASILQGIGKLQIDYRVDLFDLNGQLLKPWNPLLESMAAVGNHYYFEFLEENEASFRQRLNILIARVLMPASGYAWIISNRDVLAVWLALLNEDTNSAGTLGAILVRADAIAIQRYFNQLKVSGGFGRSGRAGRISTFVDNVPESLSEKEALIGIEFIKWLTQQLESKKLTVNNLHLFIVPGGMLISEALFKMFVEKFPQYKTWQAIQKGFLSLGLHKLGIDGKAISRFEQVNTHKMLSGIVLADYALALPEQMQIQNVNTGEISTITATELVHVAQFNQQYFHQTTHVTNPGALNHLSAAGKWESPSEIPEADLRNKRGV